MRNRLLLAGRIVFGAIGFYLLTSCGGEGSLAKTDFVANPPKFTLVPGGPPQIVRYTLLFDETEQNAIYHDRISNVIVTNPPNGCSLNTCRLQRMGDWQEFAISASTGAVPGQYSLRATLESSFIVDAITLDVTVASPTDAVFSDSTFPDAAWISNVFSDNTNGGATVTSQQSAVDGIPPPCRETTFDWNGGNGQLARALNLQSASTYNPTVSGPITSIDCSWDDNVISQSKLINGYSTYLVMKQGINLYRAGENGGKVGWQHHLFTGLTAVAFTQITPGGPGAGHPDFSASGSAIQFGYLIDGPTNSTTQANHVVIAVDNWSVTVHR